MHLLKAYVATCAQIVIELTNKFKIGPIRYEIIPQSLCNMLINQLQTARSRFVLCLKDVEYLHRSCENSHLMFFYFAEQLSWHVRLCVKKYIIFCSNHVHVHTDHCKWQWNMMFDLNTHEHVFYCVIRKTSAQQFRTELPKVPATHTATPPSITEAVLVRGNPQRGATIVVRTL